MRNRFNLWHPEPTGERDLLSGLPTVKPVAMLADILRDCTKRGDLVIDPFLGSGSALVAAHKTGRVCIGVELDPSYLDVSIRRRQRITGLDAFHAETGQPFDDVATLLLAEMEGRRGG